MTIFIVRISSTPLYVQLESVLELDQFQSPTNLLFQRVITIGGTPEGKGETVAAFLERSDQVIIHHQDELG